MLLAGATAVSLAHAARTLCVGGPGCYATLQAAVAAAQDGDTISIAPGTYAGGVTIDVSVKIAGAGAGKTIIRGGGSVLTIGDFGASSEPTVAIQGVTITGGVARSSPESIPFVGQDGVFALGGGIEIPPNADFSGGATVTISNSVISGNRVAPTTAIDSTIPCPPDITIPCINGDLPFALAAGGGIDNWGTLTLAKTTVSNNRVGAASGLTPSVASDTNGGAIMSWLGPVTISNSAISGNQATATAPNGRFADSGAMLLEGGALTISSSSLTNNQASVSATMPSDVASGTVAGGVHVGGGVSVATITNSTLSGNTSTMTNSVGDANADTGGLHIDANPDDVTLSNDTIANNHVNSQTIAGSTGNADGSSGAGEISGTFSNLRLTGNTVDVSAVSGNASAEGGASVFDGGTISNGVISDNHVHVSSPSDSVSVRGGGIDVAVSLTLLNTTVSGNTVTANGTSGSAFGGGLYDVAFPDGPDGPPGGPLVLQHSTDTGNTLSGGGITLQGGGLYLQDEPLTLTNSVIAHNLPDQCHGC
jgi:hypothetical protein